jgi:hypothetical protein
VTLECPCCRQYKTLPRRILGALPAEVRLIESLCPDCDDGGRHIQTWFSAPGVEISQEVFMRLVTFTKDMAPHKAGETRVLPDEVAARLVEEDTARDSGPFPVKAKPPEDAEPVETRPGKRYMTRGVHDV